MVVGLQFFEIELGDVEAPQEQFKGLKMVEHGL